MRLSLYLLTEQGCVMRGNDFMELRAFELVARRLSFSKAADEIGMSKASLSQIVKNLELRLGVRLLNRTTRSVALTDAGIELLERLSPALNELVEAVGNIDKFRSQPSGKIKILTGHLGADLYLREILPTFAEKAPDVTLEICLDEGQSDLVGRGFDAAIRTERDIEMDMVAIRLGEPQDQILVASSNYIKKNGRPNNLSELRNLRCISVRSDLISTGCAWKFDDEAGVQIAEVSGPLIVNNYSFALQAVLADMGLALIPKFMVQTYLETGRLEQLFTHLKSKLPAFYLCFPKQNFSTLAFRIFVDHIKQRLGS